MANPDFINSPRSEPELMARSREIAGLSLNELATRLQQPIPGDLLHAKGWIGQLLEQALGASAGNLAEPDFQQLGVELKTIPVTDKGNPKESTYVCTVPLQDNHNLYWEQSWVRNKLKRVLWVPVEADSSIPVNQRRIGQALLWSPSPEQENILKQDWEEHMDRICTGQLATISARDGQYLQIRPKAATSQCLITTHNENGDYSQTLPRGFYLRTIFTSQILKSGFHQAAISTSK